MEKQVEIDWDKLNLLQMEIMSYSFDLYVDGDKKTIILKSKEGGKRWKEMK